MPETTEEHVHRWRIEAQGGETSKGLCACGAEKAFRNSWGKESSSWMGARKPSARN
jgi:hypothetical protein